MNTNINTQDWHPADVKCQLEKVGFSLFDIARELNVTRGAVSNSLKTRVSKRIELSISEKLKLQPDEIWPSRYAEEAIPA